MFEKERKEPNFEKLILSFFEGSNIDGVADFRQLYSISFSKLEKIYQDQLEKTKNDPKTESNKQK